MKRQLASVCVLTLTVATAATVGGDYDLSWSTIDCGGGVSSGGAFTLAGTIGQPDASVDQLSGGAYSLNGGFVPGAGSTATPCPADIAPTPNGDGLVNADDLLAVIVNWGPCPVPPSACPQNIITTGVSANQVDVSDLLATIVGWGACP